MGEPRATAPRIPPEYGVPTDASGADILPWSWAVEQLEAARNYWISSTRPDGRPHAAPVWGLWLDDVLWFSTGETSQKARNLAQSSSVVVHLESGDDTVILEGVAEREDEPETFERVASAYDAKYGMRPPTDSPLFAVRPRAAYTWRVQEFPQSVARWLFH